MASIPSSLALDTTENQFLTPIPTTTPLYNLDQNGFHKDKSKVNGKDGDIPTITQKDKSKVNGKDGNKDKSKVNGKDGNIPTITQKDKSKVNGKDGNIPTITQKDKSKVNGKDGNKGNLDMDEDPDIPTTSQSTISQHIEITTVTGSLSIHLATATSTRSSSSSHPSTSSTAPIPSSSNPATHKSSPPIRPIIGGVVGGVCVLAIALALILLCHRRQSRNRAHPFDPAESEAQTSGSRLRPTSHIVSQANGRASLIEPERRRKVERRQEYLQGQVQLIQQELDDLQSVVDTESIASASDSHPGDGVDADVRRLVEQVEVMKAQIERLQGQVQSEWVQGLSDEPPPGYDAAGGRSGTITNL